MFMVSYTGQFMWIRNLQRNDLLQVEKDCNWGLRITLPKVLDPGDFKAEISKIHLKNFLSVTFSAGRYMIGPVSVFYRGRGGRYKQALVVTYCYEVASLVVKRIEKHV